MPEFWETRAGRVFYESTMPRLIGELERLNEALARIAIALEANGRRSNENTDGAPDSPKLKEDPESSPGNS